MDSSGFHPLQISCIGFKRTEKFENRHFLTEHLIVRVVLSELSFVSSTRVIYNRCHMDRAVDKCKLVIAIGFITRSMFRLYPGYFLRTLLCTVLLPEALNSTISLKIDLVERVIFGLI